MSFFYHPLTHRQLWQPLLFEGWFHNFHPSFFAPSHFAQEAIHWHSAVLRQDAARMLPVHHAAAAGHAGVQELLAARHPPPLLADEDADTPRSMDEEWEPHIQDLPQACAGEGGAPLTTYRKRLHSAQRSTSNALE